MEQIWELHKGKKVPEKVLSAEDRVTLLFGDNTGMTIAKDSAQTLARITEAKSDILNVSRMRGLEYHQTATGFYRKDGTEYTQLNEIEDSYYKHISTGDDTEYVFGASGIYQLEEEILTALDWTGMKQTYPYSKNQFAYNGHLVTFDMSAIKVVDLHNKTSKNINMAPFKVLDLIDKEDQVWVLTQKALVSISKNALLDGERIITSVVPIHQSLSEAQLVNSDLDNQLYIAGINQLIEVDLEEATSDFTSEMHLLYTTDKDGKRVVPQDDGILEVNMSDLPLTLSYSSNIYETAKAKYSFHLNHKGENNSQWQNDGHYEFDVEEAGRYTLVAKYVDDIYGSKYLAKPTQLYVNKETVIATTSTVSWWRLPLILITLLLLGSGWWLKGKLTA